MKLVLVMSKMVMLKLVFTEDSILMMDSWTGPGAPAAVG